MKQTAILFNLNSDLQLMVNYLEIYGFIVSSDTPTLFKNKVNELRDYIIKNDLEIDFIETAIGSYHGVSLKEGYYYYIVDKSKYSYFNKDELNNIIKYNDSNNCFTEI